ncbi:MAG: MurR/RpiR family transcriptional regulator [Atopobiaceae bacterium]|nr:MurR/RpiR family transcriptional regulator [Atopobiaceae bacterium]
MSEFIDANRAITYAQEASLGLPGSIKQVADFLLAEGTGITQMTMAQIAARAYTSKPTLVRFAKQAGYAGWKDYRHDFIVAMTELEAARTREAEVDVNTPFGAGATSDEVITSLARIQQLAAAEVVETLDRDALARAADILLSSHDLVHFGVMHNYLWGKVFASNLSLIGLLCRTPQSETEAAAVASHLSRGDSVIVTSYSGGLAHVPMAFVPALKERGVSIVAVTNSHHSPLALIADEVLAYAPHEHFHAKIADFYSGACTQLILNSLYAACYARRFEVSRTSRRGVIEGVTAVAPADFGHMDD